MRLTHSFVGASDGELGREAPLESPPPPNPPNPPHPPPCSAGAAACLAQLVASVKCYDSASKRHMSPSPAQVCGRARRRPARRHEMRHHEIAPSRNRATTRWRHHEILASRDGAITRWRHHEILASRDPRRTSWKAWLAGRVGGMMHEAWWRHGELGSWRWRGRWGLATVVVVGGGCGRWLWRWLWVAV